MFRNLRLAVSFGLITLASPLLSFGQQTDSLQRSKSEEIRYIINQADLEQSLQKLAEQLRNSEQSAPAQELDAQTIELLKLQLILSRLQQPRQLQQPPVVQVQTKESNTDLLLRLSRLEDAVNQLSSRKATTKTTRATATKTNGSQTEFVLNPNEATKRDLRTININATQPQQRVKRDTIVSQMPLQTREEDTTLYANLVTRLSRIEETADNKAELDQLRQQIASLQAQVNQPQTVVDKTVVEQVATEPTATDFERQVFFAVGQAQLTSVARVALDELVGAMKALPATKVHLSGFASPEGSAELNSRLVQKRLDTVANYLTSRGITADRIQTQAGGIDPTSEPRTLARRVQALLYN